MALHPIRPFKMMTVDDSAEKIQCAKCTPFAPFPMCRGPIESYKMHFTSHASGGGLRLMTGVRRLIAYVCGRARVPKNSTIQISPGRTKFLHRPQRSRSKSLEFYVVRVDERKWCWRFNITFFFVVAELRMENHSIENKFVDDHQTQTRTNTQATTPIYL